ncbi:hypothetical protein [Streptomyces sp. Ac-502]|uniref:hypothetical protein n=1 Tax=Streptomyces sp. Ac-502 TaxID=3342801 RepID=UPI0038625116
MHKLVLTAEERENIDALIDGIVAADENWDPMAAMDRAAEAAPSLPLRLRAFLAQARAEESDVTVVSGLPIHPDLPPRRAGGTSQRSPARATVRKWPCCCAAPRWATPSAGRASRTGASSTTSARRPAWSPR